ncbi:aminopeptidase P family protein [candidate division WOR-3 bacterium]|nr:aminopeptidase P family protein [candidate division WOR-3 bacterium]
MVTPLDKLRAKMLQNGWDCCVVSKILDIYFVLNPKKFINFIETRALLLVFLDDLFLISDPSSIELFRVLTDTDFKSVKSSWKSSYETGGFFLSELSQVLKDKKSETVLAVDNQFLRKDIKTHFSCRNLGSTLSMIASEKENWQLDSISEAYRIMKTAVERFIPRLKEGITEIQARNIVDEELHNTGAERLGVPTIVSFSNSSSFPDPVPTSQKLCLGDMVMYEISAGIRTEAPIFGRTSFFNEPEVEKLEVLNKALDAYRKMIDWIEVGKIAGKAFEFISEKLGSLSDYIMTVSGFSLGASSDYFYLAPLSKHTFRENEALVALLSLNIPDFGILRFSDTILVSSPNEVLTPFDYKLVV